MPSTSMHLRVLLPSQVFADTVGVIRIVAETREGSFGLLPNRLDCVAAITPCILVYEKEDAGEAYIALDEGVLVKTGPDVLVSARRAMGGTSLAQLRQAVEREFIQIDAQEQNARAVMAKLETGFLRQFATLRHG
jgi:F-type H+-transporting ATPase subunit epsilon